MFLKAISGLLKPVIVWLRVNVLNFMFKSKREKHICYISAKLIDRSPFRIDPASGLITLTKALPESVPYYTLNITAYDDGYCCDSNTRLSSNTYILVEIKDTNNNQPQFPNCNYEPRVLENQPIGTFVVKVRVTGTERCSI